MNSRRTYRSREHSPTFEPYDLVEFGEEEEAEERRRVLRPAYRAAAFEAKSKSFDAAYHEELLQKGLKVAAADYAVYGRRYASSFHVLG